VVRLFSYPTEKSDITVQINMGEASIPYADTQSPSVATSVNATHQIPDAMPDDGEVDVPLVKLAWGRSGDKGNKANIGIIARKPDYVPYIWAALSEDLIKETYAHFHPGKIERFYLPGSHAMNILISEVLGGGGVASLRNDAQAKGYAQILLAKTVKVPARIAEDIQ
jgi:hypothetical protein